MIICNVVILEELKILCDCAMKSCQMIGHMNMSSILEISSFSVMKILSSPSMMREAGSATDLFDINLIFAWSFAQDFIAYGTCLKTKFTFSLCEWNAPIVLSLWVRYLQFLYWLADVLCAFEKYYMSYIYTEVCINTRNL